MAVLTQLAPRIKAPDFIPRGVTTTIALPVFRDGLVQAPTSGTVSVFDETGVDGTPLVDDAAVSIVNSVAQFDILAATVPTTKSLDDSWQERWTLLIDGESYIFWRDAQFVLRRLFPVISDDDIFARHSELRQWKVNSTRTDYQEYIDDAWDTIQVRLLETGKRPILIMNSWALREVHIQLSLERIFRDFSSSAGGARGKYAEMADHYQKQFGISWSKMTFIYDDGEDDNIDDEDQGQSGSPMIYLGGTGRNRRILRRRS